MASLKSWRTLLYKFGNLTHGKSSFSGRSQVEHGNGEVNGDAPEFVVDPISAPKNLENGGEVNSTKPKHTQDVENGNCTTDDPMAGLGNIPIYPRQEEDDRMQAWLQVFLMHLVNFNTFGYTLSYGIFQEYYTKTLNISSSSVSWVGTVELFLIYFMGAFSGRALDAGYFRHVIALGLLMQILGAFLTSLCTEYWQLFLAQGLCIGIGNGLLFCPAVAHVSTYFSPKQWRALAMAIVASGGGTGGLVFPAVAQTLLYRIGFPWTVRIMAFIILFNSIVVVLFARPRFNKPASAKGTSLSQLIDFAALKEAPFALFCAGIFLAFWGLYFAYYYIRPYSRSILNASQSESFSLLLIVNGAGIPGRIIPALLADALTGPLNLEIPTVLLSGISVFAWAAVTSMTGAYAWSAAYGFLGGAAQALFQASSSSLAPSIDKVGARIGLVFTTVSFACLSGGPIGGALVDSMGGRYLGAQCFGGTVMVLGSILIAAARVANVGWTIRRRA